MKFIALLSGLIILFSVSVQSQINLNGIYKGEDLIINNPLSNDGINFSIKKILVNGNKELLQLNTSAVIIKLSEFDIQIGDSVDIRIYYIGNNLPQILNPEVISINSTFEIVSILVKKNGVLQWITKNESGKLNFYVEQYKWNKWIIIDTIIGYGNKVVNSYETHVVFNSGINKFRVKQTDYHKTPRYSPVTELYNDVQSIKILSGHKNKFSDIIIFSDSTDFEIFDYYGHLQIKGNDKEIDISNLEKGEYFINYDCKSETFVKKQKIHL